MSTLSLTFPVARRARRCDGCQDPILAGTRYRRWKGTQSDIAPGVLTYCECSACCDRYGRSIPDPPAVSPNQEPS
jgi:hypothetical protein